MKIMHFIDELKMGGAQTHLYTMCVASKKVNPEYQIKLCSLFGEASLMEVPAISTDIGWPHQVIVNNKNGFIVEKNIQQIAEKIIYMYENRELVYKMSKQIRIDFLSLFNTKKMAQNWKDMFNEVLNK